MITQFSMRFYRNNNRIYLRRLSDIDARLLYLELKTFMSNYEKSYGDKLNKNSILICVDENEIYRSISRLKEFEIKTIADILSYLEIENPLYVIKNNELITKMDDTIDDAYTIQVYTKDGILNKKQMNKIRMLGYGT